MAVDLVGGGGALAGDAVEVTLAVVGDLAATLAHLLEHLHGLESVEDVTDEATRGTVEVLLGGLVAGAAAVVLTEAADADALAKVDLARNRGGTDVVPVRVVRGELVVGRGLDVVVPLRQLHLAGALEVLSVLVNELRRLDVADGDALDLGCVSPDRV
jgi:hypothetical protein